MPSFWAGPSPPHQVLPSPPPPPFPPSPPGRRTGRSLRPGSTALGPGGRCAGCGAGRGPGGRSARSGGSGGGASGRRTPRSAPAGGRGCRTSRGRASEGRLRRRSPVDVLGSQRGQAPCSACGSLHSPHSARAQACLWTLGSGHGRRPRAGRRALHGAHCAHPPAPCSRGCRWEARRGGAAYLHGPNSDDAHTEQEDAQWHLREGHHQGKLQPNTKQVQSPGHEPPGLGGVAGTPGRPQEDSKPTGGLALRAETGPSLMHSPALSTVLSGAEGEVGRWGATYWAWAGRTSKRGGGAPHWARRPRHVSALQAARAPGASLLHPPAHPGTPSQAARLPAPSLLSSLPAPPAGLRS